MKPRYSRHRAAIGSLVALIAIVAFPATDVLAYNQVVRDESGCCVSQSGGWTLDRSSSNGYDTNTDYGTSNPLTGGGPWFQWYPYPSPSPLYMCSYAHIPKIYNGGWVYYSDSEGRSSNAIYQQDWANYWFNATNGNFNYGDDLQVNSASENQGSSNTYSADAVAFHYNGC